MHASLPVRLLLVLLALACGGTTDDTKLRLPAPGVPYEFDEVYPPRQEGSTAAPDAPLATVTWHDETISFYDVTSQDDDAPVLLTTFLARDGGRELSSEFELQVGARVTPAELWRAATGKEDLPALLALDHIERTSLAERNPAYLDFDADLVDKELGVASFHFVDMFPVSAPGTCWGKSKVVTSPLTRTLANQHVCASTNPAGVPDSTFLQLNNVNIVSNCLLASQSTTLPVRVGFHNGSPTGQVALSQVCFSSSGNVWSCQAPINCAAGFYHGSEFGPTASIHSLGIGAQFISQNLTGVFGAAVRQNGPPMFQTSKCSF